ncbi:MAG: dTDP-glucose 4,6-dehydratase [Pseudomonadota bacterium]
MRVLVTGGAGFIGSCVARHLIGEGHERVVVVDKLTYAGTRTSLKSIEDRPAFAFYQNDIAETNAILKILRSEGIDAVMHLAAESHVDRSIDGPSAFIDTNIVGTYRLLDAALTYWRDLDGEQADQFRFHHVSTDEVFGDLPFDAGTFTEDTAYAPHSPYAASKAASDHLARAWHATYGLPVVVSNCSNNYGPYQFPEKLIPLTILNAIEGKPISVYGAGANVRDWLHVEDHARALDLVMTTGRPGETYAVGGRAERSNLAVVEAICECLDKTRPRADGLSYREQITFVTDRPGHDRRYAIDPSKIEAELGWSALESFETGLEKTVDWYLDTDWWWAPIRSARYAGERIGQG